MRARYALLALVALSCATEENSGPLGSGLGETAGSSTTAGDTGTAGSGTDPTAGSGMTTGGGGSSSGSVSQSGSSSGGTFSVGGSGGVSSAGTFSAGGGGAGGTLAGGTGGGGAGGKASNGGGGSGGTAGKAGTAGSSGSGGSGGNPGTVKCGDHAIMAKTSWVASASSECAPTCTDPNGPYTASLAVDASATTRYSSGKEEAGDEWLQIDLGGTATVNHLTIVTTPPTDYTRHFKVRVSATSGDMAAAVLADADGAAGTLNIALSKAVNGRYVLISQTGVSTSWWSINDISVTCQ